MNCQVLRTDVESGETVVSYLLKGTTKERVDTEMERLNKLSEKDGTMNYYSYREIQ